MRWRRTFEDLDLLALSLREKLLQKCINRTTGQMTVRGSLRDTDLDEHLKLLSILLEVLREAKLTINREKSSFACRSVKYLGYIINEHGMRPDPGKIQPITNYPVPRDRTQLRQFNGMVNWYHRHLKSIAKVQGPLNKLTSPKHPWRWTDDEQKAFDEVKQSLIVIPRLCVPVPGQPFILYTDASDFGSGAILVQKDLETD
ncbi:uncharacterized protein LOC135172591 [Diachasmimorpha longicaudata]|uniref:uncharacterized protein LOC135172591 n=1 Tax=Diachasmimorpha longicaudata TaxID=58733 RepID=UPI0030B8E411